MRAAERVAAKVILPKEHKTLGRTVLHRHQDGCVSLQPELLDWFTRPGRKRWVQVGSALLLDATQTLQLTKALLRPYIARARSQRASQPGRKTRAP
jgi:hypothetical protein